MDRIETIYHAIDQMKSVHGKPRPAEFGGGKWDFNEEIKIWKDGVIKKQKLYGESSLTPLQWSMIDSYINIQRKDLKLKDVI
jgi:hypothetical protein